MKFLTPEQADWLIDKLTCSAIGKDSYPAIEQIINQCTEREFPEMTMMTGLEDETVTIALQTLGDVKEYIEIASSGGSAAFSRDQFKQFAIGVNKIVQWLDDKE